MRFSALLVYKIGMSKSFRGSGLTPKLRISLKMQAPVAEWGVGAGTLQFRDKDNREVYVACLP